MERSTEMPKQGEQSLLRHAEGILLLPLDSQFDDVAMFGIDNFACPVMAKPSDKYHHIFILRCHMWGPFFLSRLRQSTARQVAIAP
jgi:hypothetical protein